MVSSKYKQAAAHLCAYRLGWDLEIKCHIPLLVMLDNTLASYESFNSIGKEGRIDTCAKNAYVIVRWEFSPKDKLCLRLAGLACGSMYYCPENTFWTKGSRRSVSQVYNSCKAGRKTGRAGRDVGSWACVRKCAQRGQTGFLGQ